MTRAVKLIVLLAILEMILVDLALVAFNGVTLSGHDPSHRYLFQLVFFPVWSGLGAAYASRRLSAQKPRLSYTHRRYLETGLVAAVVSVAALHGFIAYTRAHGLDFDRVIFLRLTIVFVGVGMIAQGNFAAKLDPPTGERAPAAAVWTRAVLRLGWIMVLVGVVLTVAALAAPPVVFMPVLLVSLGLAVAAEVHYRWLTRRTQDA
jgi:hypothetical protein